MRLIASFTHAALPLPLKLRILELQRLAVLPHRPLRVLVEPPGIIRTDLDMDGHVRTHFPVQTASMHNTAGHPRPTLSHRAIPWNARFVYRPWAKGR